MIELKLLDLAEQQDPVAYDEIINKIQNIELKEDLSTLIYALSYYPTEPIFEWIIDWILSGSWEVAHQACLLLDNIDELSGQRVNYAWDKIQAALKSAELEDWRRDLIENDVLVCFE
ncbi:hypothetical protein [Wielerella bovis]|uniref:hypothetical protein n=1 Tax=Wielerella bovis TaxID=2917790 RepID=UPI0020186B20|nr:hypothetical protein [Wielerella bovis]ULJ60555.1 hypothetical protein MIS44_01360 [Wielerella bovis]